MKSLFGSLWSNLHSGSRLQLNVGDLYSFGFIPEFDGAILSMFSDLPIDKDAFQRCSYGWSVYAYNDYVDRGEYARMYVIIYVFFWGNLSNHLYVNTIFAKKICEHPNL